MDLLWENAAPSSAFGSQTITIEAMSVYSMVAVESYEASNDGHAYLCIAFNPGYGSWGCFYSGSAQGISTRYFRINGTEISFSECWAAGSWNNNALKPYRIYGISGADIQAA